MKLTDKETQYRQKHKRCKYCLHLDFVCPYIECFGYWNCKAKDKIVKYTENFPRTFCSCYEVNENPLTSKEIFDSILNKKKEKF